MKTKLVFYLIFCVCVANGSDNATVDYYVNLINTEIDRAHTYPLPQDSSAFKPTSNDTLTYGTFDYVIVGAGSAGAVVANRLSEIEENRVLLLEAGGHESNFSDIPGMQGYLVGLEFNWNYNTTPQTNACLGMTNNACAYPRGRGFGGSSIINALMYVRGNNRDFDIWSSQGNSGWSYKDVLPYFIKSEDSHINGDDEYHGKGGNLNVEYSKPYSPQFYAFIEANKELGGKVLDYNGRHQLGVAPVQFNTINGRRHSTGKAFLVPAINRSNLEMLPNSLAMKILIDPLTKKTHSVLFSHDGKLLKAKARKEVVVCAGTIGSPQLLMLSGIGLGDHLESLDIPVVQPLPVGNNFQDHATYYSLSFNTNYTEPIKNMEEYVKGYLNGFGTLTIPGNVQGLGFFQTNLTNIPGYPDIEIIMIPSNNTAPFLQKMLHLTDETYKAAYSNVNPVQAYTLYIMLLHPKSHGTLRLKSNSPYDYPLIDPRFLSDPQGEDIETMYQGIQLALEMLNTKAFKKLNATLIDSTVPACKHHEYLSKEYWYCQLRHLTTHIHHPTGTCKMGPDPLTGAVVNHQLKVYGITNLRVADASVIPEPTSGHTHAPVVMIAEKVSDMIKNGE